MTEEKLVTVEEASNILGVTRVRVWQILRAGDLEGVKRAGAWFIFPVSLRQLIERRAAKKRGKP